MCGCRLAFCKFRDRLSRNPSSGEIKATMGVFEPGLLCKSGCAASHASPLKVGLPVRTMCERARRDLPGHPNLSGLSIWPRMEICLPMVFFRATKIPSSSGERRMNPPCAIACASLVPCLQPSSTSTSTLPSDKRTNSTHAEITRRPGELLVAPLAVCIATLGRILLRLIHRMTLGMDPARSSRCPVPPCFAKHSTLQVCEWREITPD